MEGFTHVTKKNNGSEEIFLGCPNIPENVRTSPKQQ